MAQTLARAGSVWSAAIPGSVALRAAICACAFSVAVVATLGFLPGQATRVPLTILGLAALALASATLPWPRTVVLALLFVLFTRISDIYGPQDGPLSLSQLLVALLLGSVLVQRLLAPRAVLVWDRVLVLMLLYAAASIPSVLVAADRGIATAALASYAREILIVFLLLNLVNTGTALRRATWVLVAAAVCLAAAGFANASLGIDVGGLATTTIRVDPLGVPMLEGPSRDSNSFAQSLMVAVPLALYRAWGERRRALRVGGLAACWLVIMAIVQTFSRGGFLALLTVAGLTAAQQRQRPSRLLVLGLVAALILLAAPPSYWGRLHTTAQFVADVGAGPVSQILAAAPLPCQQPLSSLAPTLFSPPLGSTATIPAAAVASTPTPPRATPVSLTNNVVVRDRPALLLLGIEMFLANPLTGVGKGNYYAAYPHYAQRASLALPDRPMGAHNTPVFIAAETGILGLAAYAAVVLAAVAGVRDAQRRLARAGREQERTLLQAIEIGIYGFLVTSMFLNDNYFGRYLWLLVGLAAVGRQVALRAGSPAVPATGSAAAT